MSKYRGPGKWRSDVPSRTNTGSTIRGKISGPIPIPDDDEFPIRTPGTGIATPLGVDGREKQLQLRVSGASGPDSTVSGDGITATDVVNPSWAAQPPLMSTLPSHEAATQQAARPEDLRDSMASMPLVLSEIKPQRKVSSLRSVLGRLFTKKRKSVTTSNRQDSSGLRAEQHRSDPTALTSNLKGVPVSQQRSASLPINEFNRALNSHSVSRKDIPSQNPEQDTNRDTTQTDGHHARSRSAVSQSRLYTPSRTPGYVDWTGLSPRPASSHARGGGGISDEEGAIGYAVSSYGHPKRRSRSLGQLRETAHGKIAARRRSDGIRYWRGSYDPDILSPASSNKPEVEEQLLLHESNILQDNETPEDLPQPFNFGPLGDLAGMKITHAADLETRVTRLEARMLEMERTASRFYRHASRDQPVYSNPPERSPKRDRSSLVTRPRNDSDISFPEQPRYQEREQALQAKGSAPHGNQMQTSLNDSSRTSTISTHCSNHPSFDDNPLQFSTGKGSQLSLSQNTARPLSTSTTIRGIASSSPILAKDKSLTTEHYNTLVNMIIAEQAARQHLETVVLKLQRQLHTLLSSTSAPYPTPSPDRTTNPSVSGTAKHNEFANFEQDDSSDDEGRYGIDDDVFQTPNEEKSEFGEQFYDNVMSVGEVKSAPRTMSLSQMTLGKEIQANTSF